MRLLSLLEAERKHGAIWYEIPLQSPKIIDEHLRELANARVVDLTRRRSPITKAQTEKIIETVEARKRPQ